MNKICLIGIGFRPLDNAAGKALLDSDVVLANGRLLDVFRNYEEYESVKGKILVHGTVYEMLDYIGDNSMTKKISLLAAGDPMFFGIGRLVIERFGKDAVVVYPDLSSIQAAFSKIKETWSGAFLMSVHGGPDPAKRRKLEYEIGDLTRLLESHDKIAVLTDKVNNPAEIAKAILKPSAFSLQPSALKMYVCERLGYPDEKIIEGAPEEMAGRTFEHPNVVVIVQKCRSAEVQKSETSALLRFCTSAPFFGLKEDELQHTKGLITKDEVRAVTIHKLKLPQQGVLWDLGAGSGSVSIEAARLCPSLKVFAVEKDVEQIDNITANKSNFNLANIEIVRGEAPDALKDMPAPDRVFIGGSDGRLGGIIDFIKNSYELQVASYELNDPSPVTRHPSLIIVINATTIETLNEAVQCLEKHAFEVDVCEVSISRAKMLGQKRHMSALNPVFIITGEKC
ncbi:MAG: precorrin-6y C5,15-methyltransferase (decarboxylating) subunit CbiE [Nitrospirae bacterium]|nr:precorrin-6y C5,15-methyltransferase (decarboxylating) subunit CbiE [Nitrospirota bacterium]